MPQRAVQQALGRQFVYVVGTGDTVAARDVEPGPWSGNLWIIDKGLAPGDRVIVDGTQKAAPGRPVRAVALADSATAAPESHREAGSARGERSEPSEPGTSRRVPGTSSSGGRSSPSSSASSSRCSGVFAIRLLPISRYPQITPPAVRVQATFPGATAEDVAEAVAAPIEEQLSGLQGLLYYSSSNASDGTMSLQIYFDVNRSQDLAAVDVQNAVKLAEPQLPDAVRQNGITILKANTDILGVVALTSDDPRYDAAYLTNYMKLNIEDEIKRVPGIGNALTFGGLEFSMLIQLDPDRMAQLGITISDVAAAVREQNVTSPAGRLGASRRRRAPSSRCRSRPWAGSRRPSSSPTSWCGPRPTDPSSGCATSGRWCSARATTTWPAGSTARRSRRCCSTCVRAPTRSPPSRRWCSA